MIAIIVSIIISLSILLSAFVSFSPNFKSLVEEDLKRKAEESAWSYAAKSGQFIVRANPSNLTDPAMPGNLTCSSDAGGNLTCKEILTFREDAANTTAGFVWNDTEHICVQVRYDAATDQIVVDNVTPSRDACP